MQEGDTRRPRRDEGGIWSLRQASEAPTLQPYYRVKCEHHKMCLYLLTIKVCDNIYIERYSLYHIAYIYI